MKPLYQAIAITLKAYQNCLRTNHEWTERHRDTLLSLVRNNLPSGSGYDAGTKINLDRSTPNKLVFTTSFHHMDEHGYYTEWTEHTVTVTPDLAFGFGLKVTGKNKYNVKEMIHDDFHHALSCNVESSL